ncbi:helix-turn-helix transcriptional regulator [Schinkia azotoformans]|uniref:helix-turn-helix transcriptional regulator n=1 Tax=Schinkia azotoformans TaxID=1454 RepID=UPI002DC05AAC|nr:helix-turn-helix transcriptional regulator [Schinkia azotoformans]MEC1716582.1 helix-turn-helix transcriptional regulator [Schinkia azotoformans]MEC1739420.1 helix-turn-helix transcriptional regulator [Schinkia azotoformans]MEC1745510.1 helix-turn-helix transcriptional regulator [Schinkia azotoformans]MEC1756573.1 helix-turn-helix transcriptional regulator [Schinkia azotoformans]MEC1765840.1 helix-turn-helix transcriptional regulator [Schinkia azotoformans]
MHSIDQLCKEFGLTRYSLSKKSGVNDSTLANLVTRNTDVDNMKIGTIKKIAKAVGLSIDELVEKLESYKKE